MNAASGSSPSDKKEKSEFFLTLTITRSSGKVSRARFRAGTYDVGRAEGCAVRFWKRAKSISLRHARITVDENKTRIEDLESDTGTMVTGRVVHEKVLEDGDTIAVGKITMRVSLPEREDAGAQAEVVLSAPEEQEVEETAKEIAEELDELHQVTARMSAEIAKRIVGQRDIVRQVWATILARGHCLLVGVPGLAKTLMVSTFAEVLGLQSKRIQFTPDLMPSDIVGSNVLHEGEDRKRYFEFVQGPVFTQLLLADEINRTPPEDAGGAARGDAGAAGHGGAQVAVAAGPLLRDRDAEPDRAGGNLSPAGGAARPLHAVPQPRVPRRR